MFSSYGSIAFAYHNNSLACCKNETQKYVVKPWKGSCKTNTGFSFGLGNMALIMW